MDENLVPFKDNFYKECNTINFFLNLLTEIQSQIEFFEYICEKDFKLLSSVAEQGLKSIGVYKNNLKKYKNEPSNLYQVTNYLMKFLYIYYSSFKNIYQDYLLSLKKNITPNKSNVENIRKNILKHSVSMLQQALETNNRNELKKSMKETLELIMINSFKSLFNLYQLMLIYSKKKNDIFKNIQVKIEEKCKSDEINIVINEISERSYASKYKITYESLHFGNNAYKEFIINDENDIMKLSKSYLNYTYVFIKCIQIRKKLIKELRVFLDFIVKNEKEKLRKVKKVCSKITIHTKSLSYLSQGIINSWNLIFSSWNSINTNCVNFLQFQEEVLNPKLIKIVNDCNEEYKTFQKRWEKYAEIINELRKNYNKYSKSDNKDEKINTEKKNSGEKLKNYLSIDCTDFLDNNIPLLRESEIKRANEIKDLSDKVKTNLDNLLEQQVENSEKEYDNTASIDLFEEIQNIFENQLESCGVSDPENFYKYIKEKIEKIDFNDELAESARLSLAEYYENNDFDEGFEITQGEIENPFGTIIKDNEEEVYSFNVQKNLENSGIDNIIGKVKEDEISSIPIPGFDKNENLNNNNNYKTPSFNSINKKNNIYNLNNYEENDLYSDLNLINNLSEKFDELDKKKNNKINNNKRNIDINEDDENNEKNEFEFELNNKNENPDNENDNISFDGKNNENIIKESQNYNKPIHEEDINSKNKIKDGKIMNDKVLKSENKNNAIKTPDKQNVYYGILGILGLFCLKSLFSSNSILSFDSFLNVVILGIISFVFYKTQFQ
jgi:hypothetical protein